MTFRLVNLARDHWADINGYALGHGMKSLDQLKMSDFTDFVWWWATRNMQDVQEIEDFKLKLWRPPPGEVGQGPWSVEEETNAFASVKEALGIK